MHLYFIHCIFFCCIFSLNLISWFADPDMQNDIDTYISRGYTSFSVLLLVGLMIALRNLFSSKICIWFLWLYLIISIFQENWCLVNSDKWVGNCFNWRVFFYISSIVIVYQFCYFGQSKRRIALSIHTLNPMENWGLS